MMPGRMTGSTLHIGVCVESGGSGALRCENCGREFQAIPRLRVAHCFPCRDANTRQRRAPPAPPQGLIVPRASPCFGEAGAEAAHETF